MSSIKSSTVSPFYKIQLLENIKINLNFFVYSYLTLFCTVKSAPASISSFITSIVRIEKSISVANIRAVAPFYGYGY